MDTPPTQKSRSDNSKRTQQRMAAGAKTIQNDVVKRTRGKPGQPTKFTPELWAEILDRIACYENILDICADDHMPHYMTVRAWYRADAKLKADIEEAWVDAGYLGHAVNDNILRGGVMSTGDFRRDEAIVQNNRWFMGKTSQRLFGDKSKVEVTIHEPFVLESYMIPGQVINAIGEDVAPETPPAIEQLPDTPTHG